MVYIKNKILTSEICPLPWSTIGDPWRSAFINHMRKNGKPGGSGDFLKAI